MLAPTQYQGFQASIVAVLVLFWCCLVLAPQAKNTATLSINC
ncbi:hypothetical protein [Scytonema sp. UIC 10036]|nr:hypothetical protein [Scytonema sp. UIC 10036]